MLAQSMNKKNILKKIYCKLIEIHTGFRSGEYGGKYSTRTPFALQMSSKCCPLCIDTLSKIRTL